MTQTKGQRLVRLEFNPGSSNIVDDIKGRFAGIIDDLDKHAHLDPRAAAIAITQTENACMWAIKLVTTKPVEPTKGKEALTESKF